MQGYVRVSPAGSAVALMANTSRTAQTAVERKGEEEEHEHASKHAGETEHK
jgi:hypothetical protein